MQAGFKFHYQCSSPSRSPLASSYSYKWHLGFAHIWVCNIVCFRHPWRWNEKEMCVGNVSAKWWKCGSLSCVYLGVACSRRVLWELQNCAEVGWTRGYSFVFFFVWGFTYGRWMDVADEHCFCILWITDTWILPIPSPHTARDHWNCQFDL